MEWVKIENKIQQYEYFKFYLSIISVNENEYITLKNLKLIFDSLNLVSPIKAKNNLSIRLYLHTH